MPVYDMMGIPLSSLANPYCGALNLPWLYSPFYCHFLNDEAKTTLHNIQIADFGGFFKGKILEASLWPKIQFSGYWTEQNMRVKSSLRIYITELNF